MSKHGDNAESTNDKRERSASGSLPDYYPAVASDILRLCRPTGDGLWVDLGSGEGPVALGLAECCSACIVLVDPNGEALAAAREKAVAAGHVGRIETLQGRAEMLPLCDRSVDVVVSRGSIYFWDDQARGLAEVYRILRPGGQAMIGGGLGSEYPLWARQEFIRRRHENVRKRGPEAYERFLRLRCPETFMKWAHDAGLHDFEVIGEGGRPPEDPKAGLGIWLRFERQE
ncbi:MAG: class I SAM-dependent methyltransferase [Armatimonadota bacterium]